MRFVFLSILLIITSDWQLQAQPNGRDPIPDTLDWQGYFPLQPGNEWEYKIEHIAFPYDTVYVSFQRLRIVGQEVLDDTTYFVIEQKGFNAFGEAGLPREMLVRYDTSSASVVEKALFTDGIYREICFMDWLCNLNAAFFTKHWSKPDVPFPLAIPPDIVENPAYKIYGFLLGGSTLVHGIGWAGTSMGDEIGGGTTTQLTYAHVGEKTWGSHVIPTATETDELLGVGLEITALYPNPFSSKATVIYRADLPGSLVVSLYNVLGQLIKQEMLVLTPGEQTYTLDGAGLSPGRYMLRLQDDRGRAVSRLFTTLR